MNNEEYLKWRRHRKHMKVWTSLLCGVVIAGAGGAGIGIGYAIWHNQNNQQKADDFQIVHLKSTDSGMLIYQGDEMWLSAVNGCGHIEWSGLDDIAGIAYDTETPSLLKITAEYNLRLHDDLNITARDANNNVAEVKISIANVSFNKVPLNDEYFAFKDVGKSIITGFSEDVIKNPKSKLTDKGFNALDFSDTTGTNIKYIDGDCKFTNVVFDEWPVQKIDFGNLTFQENDSNQTGFRTFFGAHLSSLMILDFGTSTWWDNSKSGVTSIVYTAYLTFAEANLSAVSKLDLSSVVFAIGGMTTGEVYTACNTFARADISSVSDLDLSGAVFAANGMTTNGIVHTANGTFYIANLHSMSNLNLLGVLFATGGMTTGEIFTADSTFFNADLSSVTDLNLSGAVFAAESMSPSGSGAIHIGFCTFQGETLLNVKVLGLLGVVFAVEGMTNAGRTVNAAENTFTSQHFPNITDLNLPQNQPDNYHWTLTFRDVSHLFTIHGYDSEHKPVWFWDPRDPFFSQVTWDPNY